MKARLVVALLSVGVLCACNSGGDRDRDRDRDRSERSERDRDDGGRKEKNDGGENAAAKSGGGDATLERDVEAAAALIRPQLPMQQGAVRITGVEANGPELILAMQVPDDLDETSFDRFRQQLPVQACSNPQAQEMFRRGGTYTYRVSDSEGEEFVASISRC